jgi:LmbE family N-acetylglucosaminyl deacetylase
MARPKEFIPKSFMVIVAHPDDIEFGCAGTVAKWTRAGATGVYVLTTSGNGGTHDPAHTRESIAVLREQEETASAAVVGVHTVEYLRHNDGEVVASLDLRKDYIRMIRKHKPEVVIAMDPTAFLISKNYINHPDHRAVATATMDAIAPVASMPLMYPELGPAHKVREVWVEIWDDKPAPDVVYVDISETLELKKAALRCHKSQIDEKVVEMIDDWAWGAGHGLAPAEKYRIITLEAREQAPTEQPAAAEGQGATS